MFWSRAAALLLLATLLAGLLPAAQGDGCRLCGKLGRCCCFTEATPATAARAATAAASHTHCDMEGGRAACSLTRSAARPAAFRSAQTLPERTGAFAALALPDAPDAIGRAGQAGARRPSPFHLSPPTPPPRLRLV
jgi:hypothetical protein